MFAKQAPGSVRTPRSSRETDDRTAHLARRNGWVNNARRQKARAVMAGVSPEAVQPVQRPTVSALVPTAKPEHLANIYKTVARQQDVRVQLVLLTLGFCPGDTFMQRLARKYGVDDVVYLYLSDDVPLGECYNYCVRAADGNMVAVMDDEDHYGPHYLSDQLYSLKYSEADIVGKQAHFMYLEQLDATLLRFGDSEQRLTDVVTVPTILSGRDVLLANPFPPFGFDRKGVWGTQDMAANIYSADKYNYFQVRLRYENASLPDAQLLSSGSFQFFGSPEPRVDI